MFKKNKLSSKLPIKKFSKILKRTKSMTSIKTLCNTNSDPSPNKGDTLNSEDLDINDLDFDRELHNGNRAILSKHGHKTKKLKSLSAPKSNLDVVFTGEVEAKPYYNHEGCVLEVSLLDLNKKEWS